MGPNLKSPIKLHGRAEPAAIADVQSSPDLRHLPIDKVGIKDIRHPVLVRDR